jgi:hypothetical protein
MKKVLILAAIIVSGTTVFAQTATDNKTANVTVNVTDIRTITINSGNAPGFTLATTADYTEVASTTGKAAAAQTNVTVVSRNGYKVKATLSSNLTNSSATNGLGAIPGSKLGIRIDGTPSTSTGETAPDVVNTNTTFANGGSTIADIVKTSSTGNAGGTLGTTFNVAYNLGNFPQVINLATGAFIANVIYTIEAN